MPRSIHSARSEAFASSQPPRDYFKHTLRHSVTLVWPNASAHVSLLGEIDLLAMRALDGAAAIVVAHLPVPVIVDLAQVTFFGATGAGFLQRLARHADRGGYQVTLIAPDMSAIRTLSPRTMDEVRGSHRLSRLVHSLDGVASPRPACEAYRESVAKQPGKSTPSPDLEQALARAIETLTKKFPDVPAATITENVREAYQKFEAVPIHDFIGIFVEREVRRKLKRQRPTAD